jgi:hypothetical protein
MRSRHRAVFFRRSAMTPKELNRKTIEFFRKYPNAWKQKAFISASRDNPLHCRGSSDIAGLARDKPELLETGEVCLCWVGAMAFIRLVEGETLSFDYSGFEDTQWAPIHDTFSNCAFEKEFMASVDGRSVSVPQINDQPSMTLSKMIEIAECADKHLPA